MEFDDWTRTGSRMSRSPAGLLRPADGDARDMTSATDVIGDGCRRKHGDGDQMTSRAGPEVDRPARPGPDRNQEQPGTATLNSLDAL